MSREMKANESPNHFMVLDAIGRGMKTADRISAVTRLDKTEVELILNDLAVQRLVNRIEKKGFLRSKIEFAINETGHDLLDSKKRELEQKTKDIKQAYGSGNTAQPSHSWEQIGPGYLSCCFLVYLTSCSSPQ